MDYSGDMRGPKITPYSAIGNYPMPWGFNGWLGPAYRWFAGRPMNGHRYTDATYWRYGTMSVDISGHASDYHLLPGRLRFLYTRLPAMLFPGYAVLWGVDQPVAALVTLGLATLAAWRGDMWRRRRSFRRSIIEPVDAASAGVLQVRRDAGRGHTRVTVPADFRDNPDAKVTIRLPVEFLGADGDKARLVIAVANKLNVDTLAASWSLHGHAPMVTLSLPPAPPKMVSFQEGMDGCAGLAEDVVMLGLGPRGQVESFSLAMESPHAILNGGSGAGKSVLLAFTAAQFMRRGAGVLVLDAKYISHPWLRRVPGVHYASAAEDMHNALVWLDAELIRRADTVSMASDIEAAAKALPLLFVVMEEMTAARNRLDTYWKSIKITGEPALSPALSALANVANMGRQMRVHAFLAGQSLTAKVTGGPEGRESYGARMLARSTSNAWKMLAPQIKPAPVKREKPGRWHIVVGDTVRTFQAPFVDLEDGEVVSELIEWATSGKMIPDVSAMIEGWISEGGGGSHEMNNPSSEPPTPPGISLRMYAEQSGLELKTLLRWRERRSDFPAWVGLGANGAQLFDPDHLKAYVRDRLREPATVAED